MSLAITTLRTAPGGRQSRSSSGAGGRYFDDADSGDELPLELPLFETKGAAQGPVAEWRQSPAGAPQTGHPRGRVRGSVDAGVFVSVGEKKEEEEGDEERRDVLLLFVLPPPPPPLPLLLLPHAAASQSTAGAPKVYAGDRATGGKTPRRKNISISSVPRLPPSECPANTTLANGDDATCSTTSGKNLS